MLIRQPARSLLGTAFLLGALLAAPPPAVRAGGVAPDAARAAGVVRLQALPPSFAPVDEPAQACTLGQAVDCFDPFGAPKYLNVGSFFDAKQATSLDHYFLKLYRNESGAAVVLRDMGFRSRSSHWDEFNRFMAAGAIVTGPEAVLPKPEALLTLREVGIQGRVTGTCVEFSFGIDIEGNIVGSEIVMQPGDAAWLALRFNSYPDSIFVGVQVDGDFNDRPCDFLTRDGGQYWYQPDPLHGPPFDWGITAYTEPRPGRTSAKPSWTLVKQLYR